MDRTILVILILVAICIMVFIGMNRTGMFVDIVRDMSGTTCGNKVCEQEETKCSCPIDCESCSVYDGTCKRGYCSGNECLVEIISNCCGNQICEARECGSCQNDCTTDDCGIFSVEFLENSVIKGAKMGEDTILFNVDKLLTSSSFVFSIKAYDKDIKDLSVTYDCCIKESTGVCNPIPSKAFWSYFFNPDNAILSDKNSVDFLNKNGEVDYLFSFSFFDGLIPRTTSNQLIKGMHRVNCNFAFRSLEPENLVTKQYEIVFNVK